MQERNRPHSGAVMPSSPGPVRNAIGIRPLIELVPGSTLMKNPFLSMWLTAATTAAGSARAFWTAELRRQQKAAKQSARGLAAPASKERPSAKRRKARPK